MSAAARSHSLPQGRIDRAGQGAWFDPARYTGARKNAGEWSVESIARADLVERRVRSRSTDATTAALDAVEPGI
jgi:hypothetical protein